MSLSLYFACFLVLVIVENTNAQVFGWKGCPDVDVVHDFELDQYLGKWYELKRFYAIFEAKSICVTANYTLLGDGSIGVANRGYRIDTREYDEDIGDAVAENDGSAKLGVRFGESQPRGDYWVLDTDYGTYSLVHSCSSYLWGPVKFNIQFNWILARTPSLPQETLQSLTDKLEKHGIKTEWFDDTVQTDCPEDEIK